MLAPMPLAAQLGVGGLRQSLFAPMQLSCGGNAITVSTALFGQLCAIDPAVASQRGRSAAALKALIEQRQRKGAEPLKFGMVFPTSSHNYLLRHWLAQAGIDPDHDVQLVVIPPPQMVFNMEIDAIAGFCVGEPWNTAAVQAGSGVVLASSRDIWPGHAEKVLGVSEKLLNVRRDELIAVMQACAEAGTWLRQSKNLAQAAQILARPDYINLPQAAILPTLSHRFAYGPDAGAAGVGIQKICDNSDTQPSHEAGLWWLTQMMRWGQLDGYETPQQLIARVYPHALGKQAFGDEAAAKPGVGGLMGPPFDPDAPLAYLAGLDIGRQPEATSTASGELAE